MSNDDNFDYMGSIDQRAEAVINEILQPENAALAAFIRDTDPPRGFMWLSDKEWPEDALTQFKAVEANHPEWKDFSGAAYGLFMRNLQYRLVHGESPAKKSTED